MISLFQNRDPFYLIHSSSVNYRFTIERKEIRKTYLLNSLYYVTKDGHIIFSTNNPILLNHSKFRSLKLKTLAFLKRSGKIVV